MRMSTLFLVALAGICCSEHSDQPMRMAGFEDAAGNDSGGRIGTMAGGEPADGVVPLDGGDSTGGMGDTWYTLTLDVEIGPGVTCSPEARISCFDGAECCRHEYVRDLTGLENKFAFGSTHIAPAVSLAMQDTMYVPIFCIVTLNFGIIIGSQDRPPSTPKAGVYEFSGFQPEIRVEIYNKKFTSLIEGAQGKFVITDWAAEQYGLFAGSFEGTILQETKAPVPLRANVKGEFHFILPEPNSGAPG